MIEFDVRRSGDGVLVVHHDPNIDVRGHALPIGAAAYRELKSAAAYEAPQLDCVAQRFGSQIRFDVELKERGYEHEVLGAVLPYTSGMQPIFTSFDANAVRTLCRMYEPGRVGLLTGPDDDDSSSPVSLLKRLSACGARLLAPHHSMISPELLDMAAERGVPLFAWTANEPEDIERLCRAGVAGIITNDVHLALRIRGAVKGGTRRQPS